MSQRQTKSIKIPKRNKQNKQKPKPKNRKPKREQGQMLSNTARNTGNMIGKRKLQSKTVVFREELGPISGSVAFATNAYSLNPGQAATFPWLSVEAKQWEKYRFEHLKFIYTPQVTEYSANGIGSVVLGFDSDASDPPPNDLIHALNCTPRVFNLPCKNISLDIRPEFMNMLTDGFYVRPGNLPGQSDIKTFDCGVLNISTIGQATADPIGILAVEYRVTFFIPVLDAIVGAPKNNSTSYFVQNDQATTSTILTKSLFSVEVANGLELTNTTGDILLPQGNYIVNASVVGANTGANLTYGYFRIYKDATALEPQPTVSSAGTTHMAMSTSAFIVSDGTNSISVRYYMSFASGTCTTDATVVITAV
jgi:hypothetical protein